MEWIGEQIAEQLELDETPPAPSAGSTVRLETTAMATTFAVLMNPGPAEQIMAASAALDELHELEREMTVYRDDGDLARFNRSPQGEPFVCGSRLFEILQLACDHFSQDARSLRPDDGTSDRTLAKLSSIRIDPHFSADRFDSKVNWNIWN